MKTIFLITLFFFSQLFAETQPKIVVVGAGLSGLTAAYRLHEKGYELDVYEARSRVGGRVFSVNLKGQIGELGGQNIRDGGTATHMLTLIQDLKLETEQRNTPFDLNYFDHGKINDFREMIESYHFQPELLRSKLDSLKQSQKNMREVLQALFGPDDLMSTICGNILSSYEGALPEKLSTVYVETLYHILLGGLSSIHSNNGTGLKKHLSVIGGNGLIAEKIRGKLGQRIHLNHILKKIQKTRKGGYKLTFQNGNKVFCDILILTIPCSTYENIVISKEVIAKKRLAQIKSIQYGMNAKILIPVTPSTPYKALTDGHVIAFRNNRRNMLTLYYSGDDGKFTETTIGDIFQKNSDLVSLYKPRTTSLPVLAQDKQLAFYEGAVGHSWPNDPFAKGSYSCVGVEQEQLFTSTVEVDGELCKTLFAPIDNTLFFAGEHTTILADIGGTMEAAVESGVRTAKLIEKSISRTLNHRKGE